MAKVNLQNTQKQNKNAKNIPLLSDDEIEEAMKELGGFIDITPDDFRKIYRKAYAGALAHAEAKTSEAPVKKEKPWMRFLRPVSEPAPRVSLKEIFWSWLGALAGIGAVAYLHFNLLGPEGTLFIVGSFGASAVLIYGAIRSPLAQPRNLVGGHVVSAIIGVLSWQLFSSTPWFAAAFSVASAIAAMHFTRTLHPPGGATALIAIIGGEKIHSLGYGYALTPVFTGVVIMLAVSLILNNIVKWRRYPEFWL